MIKKIQQGLKTSFSFKLTTVLVIICICLMAVMSCTVTFAISRNYREAAEKNVAALLGTAERTAENYFAEKSGVIETVAASEIVSHMLGYNENAESDEILRAVCESAAGKDTGICSVWVVRDSDGKYVSSKGDGICSLGNTSWYSSMAIGSNKRFFLSRQGIDTDESCITAVYPVMNGKTLVGYAGTDIKYSVFNDLFDRCVLPVNGELVIFDPSGTVVYPENAAAGDVNSFSAYATEPHTSLNFRMSVGYEAAMTEGGKIIFLNNIMLMIFLAVMAAAIIITVKRECRSLHKIKDTLGEISVGNFNCRIDDDSENEIGEISRTIDSLSENVCTKKAAIDDYESLDSLTKAENRARLYECIDDMAAAMTDSDSRFAVVFFDIDNFRWINETFGHKHGDIVLVNFADKLKKQFKRVFRFSSDTFAVLIETGSDRKAIDTAVRNFGELLDIPVKILTSDIYIKCSEGAAIFPNDGQTSDALLCSAEIALARSKEKGKNRLSYFNFSLQNKVIDKAAISQLLTHALDKNELYLHYQPIISTSDNTLHGFEILVRWESEDLGYVPPSKFVQIAEETGEIVRIGMWVFETGCRFLKQLNEYNPDIIMSINVSAVQLKSHDFMQNIRRVLEITNVNPANVQVEITETVIVDFEGKAEQYINEMHSMGFGIALDDFGTGYSSLNYLKKFPISCLKVDKSFVDDIARHGKDYKITDSIIDLVHKMNIRTVAEGVETMEQYRSIINLKCDYIQGFLMSKPMDEASAIGFVKMYDEMYKPDRNKLIHTANALAKEKKEKEENNK